MDTSNTDVFPLKALSRKQRRVLGTLIEKGITTPEQYPLTLKATVTGCNQKNNREPLSNYDEDVVYQVLDELRELGLVAFIQTETGRTERYRHYCRQKLAISEPQLAILTELLLRGRQQLGELRTRASRMCAIDSQEDLKLHLKGLLERQWIRTNGPLDRRGVEVDHNLYAPGENHEQLTPLADEPTATVRSSMVDAGSGSEVASGGNSRAAGTPSNHSALTRLEESHDELKSRLLTLEQQVVSLQETLEDLRRQLGV